MDESKVLSLRELHERLGKIIAENDARGWSERNDQPVYVRVGQPKTPTGRPRREKKFPIHGADFGQEGVGRTAEKKTVWATCLRSDFVAAGDHDRKIKAGTRVVVTLSDLANPDPCAFREEAGVVVRHGRDSSGIYTEVRLDSGATEKVHRSNPKPEAPQDSPHVVEAAAVLSAAGFVPDGATREETVRVPTRKSPVFGGVGGELKTLGGRTRFKLPGTDFRATVGPRTVSVYRVERGEATSFSNFAAKEFTAADLAAATKRPA